MPLTLRVGSRGFDVAVLQAQLNARLNPSGRIRVDGHFGSRTQTALIAFQRQAGMRADGEAGPQTHAALAQGVRLTTVNHNLHHIAQPTRTTCWAASTAMMTRSSVAAVRARTPAEMVLADGSLANASETDQAIVWGRRYGSVHGLRCNPPMSWSVQALVGALRQSALMFDMLWQSQDYAEGSGSSGHMVVVSAMVSDDNPSGSGLHLQVLDPWPPHAGRVSWVNYQRWINEVTTRTYRVFSR